MGDTWLDHRHPDFERRSAEWEYTTDHYNGDVFADDKIETYLKPRTMGENPNAYMERRDIAAYTPHFSQVVDSLAGQLFATEPNTRRQFGDLGNPDDHGSVIGRLWYNADGEGMGWPTVWRRAAIDLILHQVIWVVVDPSPEDSKRARVMLIHPGNVVNWRYEQNQLVEVLVREKVDARKSIMDEPTQFDEYIHYRVDGWQRYRKIEADGEEIVVEVEGQNGAYSYFDENGGPVLPIYRVQLPLRRNIGFMLAKKANAMFNMESMRDWLLRVANSTMMIISADDDVFRKIVEQMTMGARTIQETTKEGGTSNGHRFIAPDSAPAHIASEVLKDKVKQFYISAFREYEDSAVERSATEIRQEVSSGVGAFLTLLKAAVDDAENEAFLRIEQQQFSQTKDKWFKARVQRPDDFSPFDVHHEIENKRLRYFGQTGIVPIGVEGQIQAAKLITKWDGLDVDEQTIRNSVVADNAVRLVSALSATDARSPEVDAFLAHEILSVLSDRLSDEEMAKLRESVSQSAENKAVVEAQLSRPFPAGGGFPPLG